MNTNRRKQIHIHTHRNDFYRVSGWNVKRTPKLTPLNKVILLIKIIIYFETMKQRQPLESDYDLNRVNI